MGGKKTGGENSKKVAGQARVCFAAQPRPRLFSAIATSMFSISGYGVLRLTIHDMITESRSRRKQEGSRRRQASR